jgi:hypothetical protein
MVLSEEERRERQKIAKNKYRKSEKGKSVTRKYNKYYNEINTTKNLERQNKYFKSEIGKKTNTKASWKKQGLNMENFEELYERYSMAIFCDICECVLNVEGNYNSKKCMDHDHDTGEFRNICCWNCNINICK